MELFNELNEIMCFNSRKLKPKNHLKRLLSNYFDLLLIYFDFLLPNEPFKKTLIGIKQFRRQFFRRVTYNFVLEKAGKISFDPQSFAFTYNILLTLK